MHHWPSKFFDCKHCSFCESDDTGTCCKWKLHAPQASRFLLKVEPPCCCPALEYYDMQGWTDTSALQRKSWKPGWHVSSFEQKCRHRVWQFGICFFFFFGGGVWGVGGRSSVHTVTKCSLCSSRTYSVIWWWQHWFQISVNPGKFVVCFSGDSPFTSYPEGVFTLVTSSCFLDVDCSFFWRQRQNLTWRPSVVRQRTVQIVKEKLMPSPKWKPLQTTTHLVSNKQKTPETEPKSFERFLSVSRGTFLAVHCYVTQNDEKSLKDLSPTWKSYHTTGAMVCRFTTYEGDPQSSVRRQEYLRFWVPFTHTLRKRRKAPKVISIICQT